MRVWSSRFKMTGVRLCLFALGFQALLATVACGKSHHHRRTFGTQVNLPVTKGGWRPVVGSSGLLYGSLGTAPLHAPSYKLPVPVLTDGYPSSARPLAARDATKLTSIAQSYRPTTLRTVSAPSPTLPTNQPINSYLNPFSLPNNGLQHYKFVQNFPTHDTVLIRNAHNPYAARPVFQKYPTKQQKNQYHNNILQQLTNVMPIQFGQYSTAKPQDSFSNHVDPYTRQGQKRPNSAETEIFKPEVFKLPDSETAPQFISQQVKTAQQQTFSGNTKLALNPFAQYHFQDALASLQQYPQHILGNFGTFAYNPNQQSVKGRDPLFPTTKTTFLPTQPTKQTLFNTFSYNPVYKSTPALFASTTPKLQTTANQILYGSTFSSFGNLPTQLTKAESPQKLDPNAGTKNSFKASPQDHFVKNVHNLDVNKITTYNPPLIHATTPLNSYYNDYGLQAQNALIQSYKNQQGANYNYDNNRQQVTDSVGLTQQVSKQYVNAPGTHNVDSNANSIPYHPSYEVVENESDDIITNPPAPWTVTPESYAYDQKVTEPVTNPPNSDDNVFDKPTTPTSELEEFAIITEGDKGFENGYNYNQVESQSRRPLGDDFEPIGKNKLKDYYYRVSTPPYVKGSNHRRTKKPTETSKATLQEIITQANNIKENEDTPEEPLPTLPPDQHFKRPIAAEPGDKDKIRKRNKIRRRRPLQGNGNRTKIESSTQKELPSVEASQATITEEIHTIRPRVRPTSKPKTDNTTPFMTTDLTTSALPTTAPTKPTIVKKKLIGHRRPLTSTSTTTTTEKVDTTTQFTRERDFGRESSIMKIATRAQYPKSTSVSYELKESDLPDYSHKQDEKDTPTSDVSVSLTDTLKTSDGLKEFSFHRDARPMESKDTTELLKEKYVDEASTVASRPDTSTRPAGKIQRPRLKNKLDRPKFSVKDYRSRLNSTTSTTEKTTENTPKQRFPQRKAPSSDNFFNTDVETTTERKKFMPKEPRHKLKVENNEQEIYSRQSSRQKQAVTEETEVSTQKMSSRIRNGQRRPKPNEETTETSSSTTPLNKRPLRKKIQDPELGESVQDVTVTEAGTGEHRNEITPERTRSESAIMKIADKKHHDHAERVFEHSKRVSDLTLAASKDYNTPGMFKAVPTNSRRIPSYFTIATDDPILPIEAFFPQLNQKRES